jgi:hypothetical protein
MWPRSGTNMARLTKSERQEQARARKELREKYRGERMETRMRFGIGFAVAYAGEKIAVQMLPSLTPDANSPLNAVGGVVDLGLAAGGGYLAVTDDGELGDYAAGAAVVGLTQFLDRGVDAIVGFLNRNAA